MEKFFTKFQMIIEYNLLFVFFIIAVFLNYLLFKINYYFRINYILQVQDIHQGNPSRLGGLVIYLLFIGIVFLTEINLSLLILYSLLFMLLAFLEDLRIFIKPLFRLTAIIATCVLIIINFPQLPQFDFGSLNILFNHKIFQIIFFSLAMATVINGQNIIDGTNGLSALTSLSIFACILYLGFLLNDQGIIKVASIIIVLIIAFLLFNYPFGKLFLGDGGSYFLGFLSSYLVIDIFSRYPDLPAWSAVCILFYPTLEVVFSYFRKILQKQSPFLPDNLHLHLKIFYLISSQKTKSRLFNALVAPFLGVVWLSPLALLPFSLQYPLWSILVVLCLILIYLFFYFSIPKPNKN
jgi:UDP-GlcNAc:undecaprenyl-phosphate GlcNAc-1-phosphate transferase